MNWTFGRTIGVGVAAAILLLASIGIVAYRTINSLTATSALVTHTHEVLDQSVRVLNALVDAETGERGFVLTGADPYLDPYRAGRDSFPLLLSHLRALTADNPDQQRRIVQVDSLAQLKLAELALAIDTRQKGSLDQAVRVVMSGRGKALMDETRRVVAQMQQEENALLAIRAAADAATTAGARKAILIGTIVCLLLMAIGGTYLTRSLTKQIGTAVNQIQSASTELQAAAAQQASSAKEQSSAMNEINTTISELVATSRQIAASAQSVARIAEQTATAARHGDGTVDKGQEGTAGTRRQVDVVVEHMLDLGKKSQQIGAVLEIVSELAEQTNILAINATIEASGAGEAGKRFGVVADEIRRLADRVANSTKEIRGLIDDVRGAVNTTVMATETSAKAVEAGAKQFADVATAFKQIAALVSTTTEASREIELSTKQQATAAEQVRAAVTDVAQAATETEASTAQTVQTASQLGMLSRELQRIIHSEASQGARGL